jgi:hypothetical protein
VERAETEVLVVLAVLETEALVKLEPLVVLAERVVL